MTPLGVGPPAGADPPPGGADGRTEGTGFLVAGTILVAWTVLAALLIRYHPEANALDRWGFSLVPPGRGDAFDRTLAGLRTVVLAGGSVLAAVVAFGHDRWRAAACLVGPALTVLLVEGLLKPVIARRYEAVLSFPSGTVAALAAVATAWAIAVPRILRWPVVVLGALAVALECRAVVALQWHYPSDALGGAAFGVGMVLLVDGVLHLLGPAAARLWGSGPR